VAAAAAAVSESSSTTSEPNRMNGKGKEGNFSSFFLSKYVNSKGKLAREA